MSQENIDAILKAVEALNRRDADAFVAGVSPYVAWETNPELVGLGGIYRGRAGVREFFEHLFGLETWESIHVEVEEITEASDDRPVRTETRKMQFLYDSGDAAVFMDHQSYDQVEIPKSVVGDALKWVPPNSDVDLLFVDERAAGAQAPSAVDLAITQTDPGLKGDTASGGGTKPATLETGVVVQVPLFIEEGERVRVDTRTGEYVSRA
jgi:translation elongation factor P